MKFVDVFQFFNYLLEEMSRCNCFSLQLLGGGDSRQTLDREAGVCIRPKFKGTADRETDKGEEERISFADVLHSVSLFCIMKNLHRRRRRNPRTFNGSSTDDYATISFRWFSPIRQMHFTPTYFFRPFLRKYTHGQLQLPWGATAEGENNSDFGFPLWIFIQTYSYTAI